MPKLKLRIDSLTVESFDTLDAAGEARRGTVRAAGEIRPASERPAVCFGTENVTGSCCEVTFAISCAQTNCFEECILFTVDPCA